MSQDLLLEIGTEEIPAHVIPSALAQLKKLGEDNLNELRIKFEEVKTLGTPRRLALIARGVDESQADVTSENRGPSVKIAFDGEGNPTKAAQGFARGQGIDPADLIVKDGYVYAKVHKVGTKTESLLAELMPKIISSLSFPNSMRWGAHDYKFIRPIRWLVGLYGDKIIDFTVADVKSGKTSRGHRFLSAGDFSVDNAAAYEKACEANFVIVDQEKRKSMIREQIEAAAAEHGGKAEITDDLLEEVLYLVEYPTALVGKIEPEYLKLPAAAVITPMRDHQRYFPIRDQKDGKLLPLFITVRNGGKEHLDTVRRGNERVLKARLEDAKFFFNEDRQKTLDEHRDRLKTLVFQEGLGSMYDKTGRVTKLVEFLTEELSVSEPDKKHALRAAELCKADLITGMVTEFTELQGVMGREYARLDGEDEIVATAIDEHYLPRFAGDSLPQTTAGRLVSIADKIDTIVGTFSRGKIPTGSEDPFALRRQALGLVLTIIDGEYVLSLAKVLDLAMTLYGIEDGSARAKMQTDFADFLRLRLKNVLDGEKIRYDAADAVLNDPCNPYAVKLKACALQKFLNADSSTETVQAFLRVINISKKAEVATNCEIDTSLFAEAAEKTLYEKFVALKEKISPCLAAHDYDAALSLMAEMKTPINAFFDAVMVMDENERIRNNRLALVKSIGELLNEVGDFGKLVV